MPPNKNGGCEGGRQTSSEIIGWSVYPAFDPTRCLGSKTCSSWRQTSSFVTCRTRGWRSDKNDIHFLCFFCMDPAMCPCVVTLLVQVHHAAEDIDMVFSTPKHLIYLGNTSKWIETIKSDPYVGVEHEPRKIEEICETCEESWKTCRFHRLNPRSRVILMRGQGSAGKTAGTKTARGLGSGRALEARAG